MPLYKRKYRDYQHYLDHQREKLTQNIEHYQEILHGRVESFKNRLSSISPKIPGKKVLCLGARLGEEVKAFRQLGHTDAIGIDLNPGPNNQYVIEGDFHSIPFDDAAFDGVYCNCLDHARDLRKVSIESARVLKPGGILALDVPFVQPHRKRNYRRRVKKQSKYEAMVWDSLEDVINQFHEFAEVYDRIPSATHIITVFMQKKSPLKPPKEISQGLQSMDTGTVTIHFTKGFGNNLFQYVFGRLLAETHGMKLNHPAIPQLSIPKVKNRPNRKLENIEITSGPHPDNVYHRHFDGDPKRAGYNYYLRGYFEDYTLYKPHLDKIRSWFPDVPKTNTKDLVIHMRLHNRLLQWSHHINHISAEGYKKGISKFDFDRLHIVSDAKKWDYVTEDDIKELTKEVLRGPTARAPRVPIQDSVNYMNELVDVFKEFNPIFHHTTLTDDFNFIRSFDKIVVYNSTFAWWAATLSRATQIGVFEPWKPRKAGGRNKNLGKTDFPGWFQWGSVDDLIIKSEDLEKKEKEMLKEMENEKGLSLWRRWLHR